ncbi:TetR/AcrR family transcriptional regulator [Microbacterium jejuense]|uniref:TetR/AcrR family transcriptional regulator n=1 Tax=Microbacterium jejuense TaxID=1263637 RepID=A0ABS7HSG5_9MICO|nr:TetR/AcrR family transcriptional regulator [Microbacterium jejuense]MBW9095690.1 TetR/AcrR family transcriptional regulator [Microbacterium jejuense]
MSTPARRDATASTARIRASAREEFATHGFEGARVDRIAARAGVNKALLFQRFGDKAGLYTAALAEIAEAATAARARIASQYPDGIADGAQFRALVRDLAVGTQRLLESDPTARGMLAWERAAGWVAFHSARPETTDPAADLIAEWFRAAERRGWLRAGASAEQHLALCLELVCAVDSRDEGFVGELVADALAPAVTS